MTKLIIYCGCFQRQVILIEFNKGHASSSKKNLLSDQLLYPHWILPITSYWSQILVLPHKHRKSHVSTNKKIKQLLKTFGQRLERILF